MLRHLFAFGLLLIFVALILLVLSVPDPENTPVGDILTALHCRSGERIVRFLGMEGFDPIDHQYSQSVAFYCKSATGQRDVTTRVTALLIGVFMVLLLGGLGLVIITKRRMMRQTTDKILDQLWEQTGYAAVRPDTPGKTPLPPEIAQLLAQALEGYEIVANEEGPAAERGDWSDSLQQLENARTQGLVTEEEYDTIRQAILRSFGK